MDSDDSEAKYETTNNNHVFSETKNLNSHSTSLCLDQSPLSYHLQLLHLHGLSIWAYGLK